MHTCNKNNVTAYKTFPPRCLIVFFSRSLPHSFWQYHSNIHSTLCLTLLIFPPSSCCCCSSSSTNNANSFMLTKITRMIQSFYLLLDSFFLPLEQKKSRRGAAILWFLFFNTQLYVCATKQSGDDSIRMKFYG